MAAMIGIFPSAIAKATTLHTDYAVLFSGGYNAGNNHDRYYDQTLRMWDITTNVLGFDVGNVYVLFADGTDPEVDRSSGVNSDWSMIVNAGGNINTATHDTLKTTVESLYPVMDQNSSFYFWSFDHGSDPFPYNDNDVELTAWGTPAIRDDELASWVEPFNAAAEIYAFGQCYAGGMADDLNIQNHNNRFAAWAASGCEPSWGDGWIDAWADGIESGLRGTHALGQYAVLNDPFGPSGTGWEHPGWTGENINIVTNQKIPEPTSAIALFSFGCLGLVVEQTRQRRKSTGK